MQLYLTISVLTHSLGYIYGNPLLDKDKITWPPEYHFKMQVLDFQTTVNSEMEIWYSSKYESSSIEVFGTKKTYYTKEYGIPYVVQPITNKDGDSKILCVGKPYEEEVSKAHNFLPDGTNFTNSGQITTLYDKLVEVWTSESGNSNLSITETLYVTKTSSGFQIPVQHYLKWHNLAKPTLLAHKITEYYDFYDTINEKDVKLDNIQNCTNTTTVFSRIHDDNNEYFGFLHPDVPTDLEMAFERYKEIHNKKYHQDEHLIRNRIFERNWRMIVEHNRKELTYKLALNQFADKTEEELKFLTMTLPSKPNYSAKPCFLTPDKIHKNSKQLPPNLDLRMEGIIGPVKNQGLECASCWAFATTAAVEAALAKKHGQLLDLSEQSLIDCSWQYGNLGCSGGFPYSALEYVMANGIPKEVDYNYRASEGFCEIKNMKNVSKIRDICFIPPNNPDGMKVALHTFGPVIVSIRTELEMMFYASGVYKTQKSFSSCRFQHIDHAVIVVGYGERNGDKYWLIKNTFGQAWGELGYILLSADEENCFLTLSEPCYPIL